MNKEVQDLYMIAKKNPEQLTKEQAVKVMDFKTNVLDKYGFRVSHQKDELGHYKIKHKDRGINQILKFHNFHGKITPSFNLDFATVKPEKTTKKAIDLLKNIQKDELGNNKYFNSKKLIKAEWDCQDHLDYGLFISKGINKIKEIGADIKDSIKSILGREDDLNLSKEFINTLNSEKENLDYDNDYEEDDYDM